MIDERKVQPGNQTFASVMMAVVTGIAKSVGAGVLQASNSVD